MRLLEDSSNAKIMMHSHPKLFPNHLTPGILVPFCGQLLYHRTPVPRYSVKLNLQSRSGWVSYCSVGTGNGHWAGSLGERKRVVCGRNARDSGTVINCIQ